MAYMRAIRLHEIGGTLKVDQIERPSPGPMDVLVRVRACGVIPNLKNVTKFWPEWNPYLPLPPLPAIFGLDAAGEVAEVGSGVRGVRPGDRVYVNPGIGCGSCLDCRRGEITSCTSYTFLGYFGFGEGSKEVFEAYPYAGFAQYMTAPVSSLVSLHDNISYEEAARFGYLGTSYSGLLKGGAGSGSSVIISGATGTLGVGAVALALAMGCSQIFAVARNRDLLAQLQTLDPDRILIMSTEDGAIGDWVREKTGGRGADVFVDAIGPGAAASVSLDIFDGLRRGGKMVAIGALRDPFPIDMHRLLAFQQSILGSLWLTIGEGQQMADMCASGALDLSFLQHERFALDDIGSALDAIDNRRGGFSNVVIVHD